MFIINYISTQVASQNSLQFYKRKLLRMANAGQLNQELWKEVAVSWSIKGYHFFKIRPCEEIAMEVVCDHGNQCDPQAMKVMMPDTVPSQLMAKITRPGDR